MCLQACIGGCEWPAPPLLAKLRLSPALLPCVPQGPTLALLNVALLACVLALVSLIAVFGGAYSALVPHLLALLLLCVGLAASINW